MTAAALRLLRLGLRVFVAVVVVAAVVLTLVQHFWADGPWWVELSRYAPYAWLLWPCGAALLASLALGRWWTTGVLTAIVLVLVVQMDLQFNGSDTPPDGVAVQRLRVMTYNVKAQMALERPNGVAEVAGEIVRHDPDIVVAQDAEGFLVNRPDPPRSDATIWGLPHVYAVGQYIAASRWPLRDCAVGQIGYRNERHRYLYCTVDADGVPVTLVTAHFLSPRSGLNAARRAGLQAEDEWEVNFDNRMKQARALAVDLGQRKRPLVVAGDLNATQDSPVLRTLLDAGLRDAFSTAGRGWGYTYGHAYRRGWSYLRIDHILVSPDIGVARAQVGGGEASQHKPVIADLWIKR